jgi:hypothetical protein
MLAVQVVNRLPEFTPALLEIAQLERTTDPTTATREEFAADLRQLGVLPRFEGTGMSRVIPVNRGLNASPQRSQEYHIMDVHSAIRRGVDNGLWAMEHVTDYAPQLHVHEKVRAGRAIKRFAGLAIVRATQLSPDLWRRGGGYSNSDGEGRFIAAHRESYEALRPLMTWRFRRLVDGSIAEHAYRAHGYSSGTASERL